MIQKIKNLFNKRRGKIDPKYKGLSDFMLNATPEERIKIMTEAARRANEDQFRVFQEANKLRV